MRFIIAAVLLLLLSMLALRCDGMPMDDVDNKGKAPQQFQQNPQQVQYAQDQHQPAQAQYPQQQQIMPQQVFLPSGQLQQFPWLYGMPGLNGITLKHNANEAVKPSPAEQLSSFLAEQQRQQQATKSQLRRQNLHSRGYFKVPKNEFAHHHSRASSSSGTHFVRGSI
ncbi:hypothetical protein niasHT_022129 [Heterodera trifolii]|uniref:Uncharacterized protein n=1 Tax=Heterodera trifolii TaxID=157864 RepID=A0ABD2K936_9BILA